MAAIADFSPCISVNDDQHDEAVYCDSLEDLHGHFCCDHKSDRLKRVVVEFDAPELTCFQVRLVRFLAKSALNLQEVVIDGGKGYDSTCIDQKVTRWLERQRPSPPPIWPLLLSEFPELEAPLAMPDKQVDIEDVSEKKEEDKSLRHYMYSSEEEDDEEEDISPRHYKHTGRKKKKGVSLEFSVAKPNLMVSGWRRRAIRRRHRHLISDWEGEENEERDTNSELPTLVVPLLYEFPLLRRPPPLAPQRPSSPPEAMPLGHATPPDASYSATGTYARESRAVRLADLEIDAAASRRCSHSLPPRHHSLPAVVRRRCAKFPGRPSRNMRR